MVVMPGETVGVWINKVYEFFKVEYIETIPRSDPIEQNFGIIAAGAITGVTQLALLEMPNLEFGQFRAEVEDDFSAILSQGRADQRHKLFTRVATYTRFTHLHDPCGHTTEFYVHEDQFAFVQAQNLTDYALTISRIVFHGFRYVLEKLKGYDWKEGKLPDQWTRIPATAHL